MLEDMDYYESKSSLSPFSDAPYDILAEILMTGHNSQSISTIIEFDLEPEIIGWAVSNVCRHWRKVALSMPLLWSHAVIRDRDMARSTTTGITSRLSLLLERSKETPLTLRIFCTSIYQYPTERLNNVFSLLSPHLSRVENLHFSLSKQGEPALFMLFSNATSLPLLRFLSFQFMRTSTYENTVDWQPIRHIFSQSPLLDRIHLDIPQGSWLEDFEFPWSQIRSLGGRNTIVSSVDFFKYLCRMPNLVHIDWVWVTLGCPADLPAANVRSKYLTRLGLALTDEQSFEVVLSKLDFPALREVQMWEVYCAQPIVNLLARSKCALQIHTLSITGSETFGSEGLIGILVAVPNIVDLFVSIYEAQEDDTLSRVFLLPSRVFLPLLKRLEVHMYEEQKGMKDFLRAVPHTFPKLQSAKIDNAGEDYNWTLE